MCVDRGTLSAAVAYGGGSSAENAGTSEQIVQALSGVGSCCVVRLSYAHANNNVNSVRYRLRCCDLVGKSVNRVKIQSEPETQLTFFAR